MPSSWLSSRKSLLFGNCGKRQNIFRQTGQCLAFPNLLCVSILMALLCGILSEATSPVPNHPYVPDSSFPRSSSFARSESSAEHPRDRGDLHHQNASFLSRGSGGAPTVPPVLSLAKACRKEIQLYCGKSMLNPLQCLLEHYYTVRSNSTLKMSEVYSELCYSWLEARDICVSTLRQQWHELCGADGYVMNVRECLRRVPPPLLPKGCRESDYYHSVRLAGKLRRQIHGHAY